jgi:hypothetical protein
MKYLVEHMQGNAGYNEIEIETVEIEAGSPREAIELVTNDRDGGGWHWDGDSLMNDSAANRAGSYCDYWMATEVAPDLLAEVERLTEVNKDLADALECVRRDLIVVDARLDVAKKESNGKEYILATFHGNIKADLDQIEYALKRAGR